MAWLLEFRLLGPVEAVVDGRPVALPAAKPRAVLAVLLLDRNRVVSVGRLIEDLWGDEPPETAIRPGPAMRAWPWTRSTLFLRKRNSTPLELLETTDSLCFTTPVMSSSTPETLTPCSADSCAFSYSSAVWRIALVGMQPRSVQVPPSRGSFSMHTVLRPSCPARMDAT